MPRITHKNLIGLPLLATTFAFGLLPVLGQAQASNGAMRSAPFGMVGLARGQTARLNGSTCQIIARVVEGQCAGIILSFTNSAGMLFLTGTGAPVMASVDLMPGMVTSLDLTSRDAFLGSSALRMPFRGTVEIPPAPVDPDMPDPCARLVPTLEIFDNLTARTTVLYAPIPDVERNIDDCSATDTNGIDPPAIEPCLKRVVTILERANARLTALRDGILNPVPDDQPPPILLQLGVVDTQAALAVQLAKEVRGKVTGDPSGGVGLAVPDAVPGRTMVLYEPIPEDNQPPTP